jgi:hypothetical protein
MSKIINGKENSINYFQKKFILKKTVIRIRWTSFIRILTILLKTQWKFHTKVNILSNLMIYNIFLAATKLFTQDRDP